jgi:hypothetical protein
VNSSAESEKLLFDIENLETSKTGLQWIIQNDDPESFNVPGQTPGVTIVESKINFRKNSLTVPGYSIVLLQVDRLIEAA